MEHLFRSDFEDLVRQAKGLGIESLVRAETGRSQQWLHSLDGDALSSIRSIRPPDLGLGGSVHDQVTEILAGDVRRFTPAAAALRALADPLDTLRTDWLRSQQNVADKLEAIRNNGGLELPALLEPYRVDVFSLAGALLGTREHLRWTESLTESLNAHVALGGMLDAAYRVDRDLASTVDSVLASPLHGLRSMRDTWAFLDIAGLLRSPGQVMPRAERRRRLQAALRRNTAPRQVRNAHSLVHRHEKTLREVISRAMAHEYGEDWAERRLRVCECAQLLGRPLLEGESVLDAADFSHYREIMCHPEHFEQVFAAGFDDVKRLRATLDRLRVLRSRSHHARTFTEGELREMATSWREICAGLEGLAHLFDGDPPR